MERLRYLTDGPHVHSLRKLLSSASMRAALGRAVHDRSVGQLNADVLTRTEQLPTRDHTDVLG